MSRVRAALASVTDGSEPPSLVARGGGYLLRVEPTQVDVHRFARLVQQARAATEPTLRSTRLASALELWRGPALADAATGVVRQRLCGGLEELRFAANSDRIDAELDAGRHEGVIAELSRLTDEHPLRERLYGQLMVALYRSGRRGDALEVYRRARGVLLAELGLEPGPQLQAVHASVIADTVGLGVDGAQRTPATPVPRQLPADSAGFTGRASELAALQALSRAETAPPATVTVCVLTGAAGVGKTSLAVRFGHLVRDRFPDGQLFVDMRGFHTGPAMPAAEALPLLLTALGWAADQVPVSMDAQAALYRSVLAGRRVLLVLDNVAHVDQVRPLLPGDSGCLVVVTSRDRLSTLVALDSAHRITLEGLPPTDAIAVLARSAGSARVQADPTAVAELAKLCGHLPLALRIAAAQLADRPDLDLRRHVTELATQGRIAGLRVDGGGTATVRGALELSYQALSSEARRVFRLVSLVPAPAGLVTTAAAALTGLPVHAVESLIDALARLHLVKVTATGRVFCHDLLLQYAAELAAETDEPAERDAATVRLLHFYLHTANRAANVLIGRTRLQPSLDCAPAGVTAVEFVEQSDAREWVAAEWTNLIAALDHAVELKRHRLVWQLADALRGFMQMQAPPAQALRIVETGLAAARTAGDVFGEAAMRHSLGYLRWRMADYPAMIEEGDRVTALARRVQWAKGEAAGLANSGIALIQLGQTWSAIRRFNRSLAIDRKTGDRIGEGTMLNNLAAAYEQVGNLATAAECAELAVTILAEIGQHQGEAIAHENLAMVRRQQYHLDDALAALNRSLAISRAIGAYREEASALHTLGLVHRDAGRYDEATDALTTSLDLARRGFDTRVEGFAHTGLASVEIRQGRFADAAVSLEFAMDIADRTGHRPGKVEAVLTRAELHNAQGDHHGASQHATAAMDQARTSGYALAIAQAHSQLATASLGIGDLTACLAHCRQAQKAQQRYGQRLAYAQTLLTMGHAYHRLGNLRSARARWRQAQTRFTEFGAPERGEARKLLVSAQRAELV
ncbi:BTAD domain-containing putative transcriptional regulator [Micromonospora sp. KC606]|uniref:AfsR/SARP family transcriptional regulator n=1 Tax=Micromonospora sp. KC606 TaxID=2530379 RepID=UPI001FB6DF4A|nr:BTAD domain-containing putative transcriptional regulator [Micromonospora sp. KC606]